VYSARNSGSYISDIVGMDHFGYSQEIRSMPLSPSRISKAIPEPKWYIRTDPARPVEAKVGEMPTWDLRFLVVSQTRQYMTQGSWPIGVAFEGVEGYETLCISKV
jgi:hypothetical protein